MLGFARTFDTDTFARNPADHDAVRQHGHHRGLAHYRHMLARPAVHQGLREEGLQSRDPGSAGHR